MKKLSKKIRNISHYMGDVAKLSLFRTFGVPHITPSPDSMKIVVTNRCNARCISCSYWKNRESKELSAEEIKKAIVQAKEIGAKSILFYGGEPLISPNIFDLISYARMLNLRSTIISNGLLLDDKKAESLVKSGISHVTISIHGNEAVHDQVMGRKGAYNKAANGARLIKKYWELHRGNEKLPLMVNALIMKPTLNIESITSVVDFCRELGAEFGINVLDPKVPYFDIEGVDKLWIDKHDIALLETLFQKLLHILDREPYLVEGNTIIFKLISAYFKDQSSNRIPCNQGFLGPIFLDSSGDVHACSVLKPLGNIRERSLHEIVGSREWQKRAEDMLHLKCPKCLCGFPTRITYHLPSYWRELTSRLVRLQFSRFN